MASFSFGGLGAALDSSSQNTGGVDFSGKSLKLDSEADAKSIIEAINACPHLHHLTLTGNTLGVSAAEAIAKALEQHPEFKLAKWSDMFTGRMKTEIPPALKALGDGMITAGARLTVLDLSDNAFGPIGVEGLAKLLESEVCTQLQELRLNNNGLGITGGKLLAKALTSGQPPRLRVFVAGRNRLENEGAKALAGVFQQMGSLQEISMPQNGIYHIGVTALSQAFKLNPELRTLNLNDNTVGGKGADAIATALPFLKNLKHINFGDCLLKSKGASTLAKAIKDNSLALETLDLSHNEIGRIACMEVVDSLTSTADRKQRLTKVVLAGNSLGGADKKKSMKDKLGEAAELSEGEGSDEEYVTGSEEEEESEDEGGSSSSSGDADSSTEDVQQHLSVSAGEITLDDSGVEEVVTAVSLFLDNPSLSHFRSLGTNAAEVIDTHLQVINEPIDQIEAYVEATLKLSGLSLQDPSAGEAAINMYKILMRRSGERPAQQWMLANAMLVGLGLIKSEKKNHSISWDLQGCFASLETAMTKEYFPKNLAETLRFFIHAKKGKF